jgi:hypothetical protein
VSRLGRPCIPLRALFVAAAFALVAGVQASAKDAVTTVSTDDELRAAVSALKPGGEIVIRPGKYRGGLSLAGLAAADGRPTVIRGADPADPPVFEGGSVAWHLSDCNGITLRSLEVRGMTGNGVNVDDGGTIDTPSSGVTIEDVVIRDTGPRGNCDALKLSGLVKFAVRRCRIEGWGGSAIDMVGCRSGVVEDCVFTGKDGFDCSNGVQMKGGTEDVLVQTSFFDRAGFRAINLGGSTGLQFFRPKPGEFEARRITVAGNRFVGGQAAVAFVGSDAGRVVRNTIVHPTKWVLRILQEQRADGFLPCRGGVFEENLVVLDERCTTAVNVGDATAPETFTFRRNAWFRTGGDGWPQIPAPEKDAVRGVDPKLEDVGKPTMRATSKDPRLKGIGADAYERPR